MVWHVSEEAGIAEFVPRPTPTPRPGIDVPIVWAVDDARLHTFLVPRDCPRVTYYALPTSTAADIARLLGTARAVVAIEQGWWERMCTTRLYLYRLPHASFWQIDDGSGHWVSAETQTPLETRIVGDLPAAIAARGVELRVLEDLWALSDAVVASTLHFSNMRMRNARTCSVR